MAIQIPNPGTGNGQTGDNEFVLWSKVKGNFENQTHAASRLVGNSTSQIPNLSEEGIGDFGYMGRVKTLDTGVNLDNLANTTINGRVGMQTGFYYAPFNLTGALAKCFFMNVSYYNTRGFRLAANAYRDEYYLQASNSTGDTWQPPVEIYHTKSRRIYDTTTAAGANVFVNTDGALQRSTSSERYKDIIADLELDDAAYENAMQLAPIVYRSTAEADNPDYHYYSFSAEKLGAYDPAFTLWRDTETVTDDEGNVTEQPLDERQAEGINLNAIVAFLHATNIKQGKMIKVQAEAIETLTKRIDAITT